MIDVSPVVMTTISVNENNIKAVVMKTIYINETNYVYNTVYVQNECEWNTICKVPSKVINKIMEKIQ